MNRLLIVEDEEVILKALTRLLVRNHYDVEVATTVEQATELVPSSFDLVLADLRLPGAEGISLIPMADPAPVVIMTSHASVRSAVEAMRHGAIDYIAKPFDHDELLMVIERALNQNLLQAQNRALRLDVERICPPTQHVEGSVLEVLLSTLKQRRDNVRCLHFYGERGTEREGLARAVHAASTRGDAPFLITEIIGHSADRDTAQLFGSNKTPSSNEVPSGGYLQAAQNGTLVIRHIEHLAPTTQQLLAKALVGDSLEHAASGKRLATNVRVIAISEASIENLVNEGSLCEELAALFKSEQYEIPPLRSRPSDIIPLAYQQLRSLERRHALATMKLNPDAESALLANQWPGNVTELDNVLTRAAIIGRSTTLTVSDLGLNQTTLDAFDLNLDEYFRYVVLRNQKDLSETELASRLGISRKALWERRQKMNLSRESQEDLST